MSGGPHLILCATGPPKKIRNIHTPNFCSTFTPTIEHLFVPALGLRHQGPFVEGPIGGSFWGTFTEGPYLKDIFWNDPYLYIPVETRVPFVEGLLWEAHIEDPFEGALQRGPLSGSLIKKAHGLCRGPLPEGHFGRPLFVHYCTNKGPLVEGVLWEAHTEGPFMGAL